MKDAHRGGHVELLEMQQRKVPRVMRMDRPSARREQRKEGLHMRKSLLHPALPDQDVGEGMLRPGISRLDAERAFGAGLGRGVVVAQLAGERSHRKKIRVVGVHGPETVHVRAKSRAHVFLAKHVIEKLRELRA